MRGNASFFLVFNCLDESELSAETIVAADGNGECFLPSNFLVLDDGGVVRLAGALDDGGVFAFGGGFLAGGVQAFDAPCAWVLPLVLAWDRVVGMGKI